MGEIRFADGEDAEETVEELTPIAYDDDDDFDDFGDAKTKAFWRTFGLVMLIIGAVAFSVALTWGTVAFFVWLFSLGWGFWQWVVGILGSLVVAFFSIGILSVLDEQGVCDYTVSGLIFLAVAAVANFLLAGSIGEGYQVIFGCFSVVGGLSALALAGNCFGDMEEGFGAGYLLELGGIILLMVLGLVLF